MSNIPAAADEPEALIRLVIYGSKSTEDRAGSIDGQVQACLAAVERLGRRELIAEPFFDEGVSGYRRSRGAGLAAAIETAKQVAREHGAAELWTFDADRLARGDGRQARHLGGLYFDLLEAGVTIRLAEGDERDVTDPIYAFLRGQRNHQDSAAKSKHTTAGLKRAAERGDWLGGRVPDGYLRRPRVDNEPTVLDRDPKRAPVIRRVHALGLLGVTSGEAARQLNAAEVLSAARRADGSVILSPWKPWKIRQVWALAHYAAIATHKGKIVGDGNWPRLIEPEDWRRLQKITAARAEQSANRGRPGQRRTHHHVLAGLGRCGQCGEPIHTLANQPRKDGTVARRYQCRSGRDVDGRCTARASTPSLSNGHS